MHGSYADCVPALLFASEDPSMGRKVRDVILFVLAVAGCVVLTIALGGENIFGPAMIYNLVFLGIMTVIYLFALIGGVFRLTDVSSWLQDSTEQIDDKKASLFSTNIPGLNFNKQDNYPELIKVTIDKVVKLREAIKPFLS